MTEQLLLYGSRLDARRLTRTLEHLLHSNLRTIARGEAATPICIWGTHGLGKTMLVEELARKHGWAFCYCAPAQFEEMGDLHGLPMIRGDTTTVFAPPDWVPATEGPGILLLDDINRADDRILRGLMQLLQQGRMFSGALPKNWMIIATANPEGGDYSVTPMDDAMVTRFLHLSLVFDARSWAAWAVEADFDPRGIAFVLCYPELVNNRRTTPRTLTQFFGQIRHIPDLLAERELVFVLGNSALEETTVAAFMGFIADNFPLLLSPEEILDPEEFPSDRVARLATAGQTGTRRVDRIGAVCTRLLLHLSSASYRSGPHHAENLVRFLLHPNIPHDLRLAMHRDLLREGAPGVPDMLRDRRLAQAILGQL
ncbi:MAG TPA: AAA family ATPase [Myxococcota bacterium]|nr:AAA family ATPase [Myxococcota bacterium]